MTQKVVVSIKGLPPGLLMHRFPMEPIEGLEKKPKAEQAEYCCYRNAETGELYIPGNALQQSLVAAATYSKGKGRGSLQKIVAASVFVLQGALGIGTKKYEIDSRPVVVPATGGRVIRHRPLITEWETTFDLTYDDVLMNEQQMRKVVDNAGSLCGLLDYRPNCTGPHGRFIVTSWKMSDDE